MTMTMIMNVLGKKQRAPPSLLCGKTFLGRVNTKTAPIVLTDDQDEDDHDDHEIRMMITMTIRFLMTEFGDDNIAYNLITFLFSSIFVTQIFRHFFASISHRSVKISLMYAPLHHVHFFGASKNSCKCVHSLLFVHQIL